MFYAQIHDYSIFSYLNLFVLGQIWNCLNCINLKNVLKTFKTVNLLMHWQHLLNNHETYTLSSSFLKYSSIKSVPVLAYNGVYEKIEM